MVYPVCKDTLSLKGKEALGRKDRCCNKFVGTHLELITYKTPLSDIKT